MGWSDDVPYDNTTDLRRNKTGQPVVLNGGDLVLPTDHVILDAEDSDFGATVEFLAPKAGVYKIRGDFKARAANSPGHFVRVEVYNKASLFAKVISHGNTLGFNVSATLVKGDGIDFITQGTNITCPTQTGLAIRIVGPWTRRKDPSRPSVRSPCTRDWAARGGGLKPTLRSRSS